MGLQRLWELIILGLNEINWKSRDKPGQTSKYIFPGAWFLMYWKPPEILSSGLWFPYELPWNCVLQFAVTGIWCASELVINQDDSWLTWRLGKELGLFRRWLSPMFTTLIEESCWAIVSMETEFLTQSWRLQLLMWSQPAYCHFLNEGLDTCRDDILLLLLKTHENVLSHYARVAQTFLGSFCIKGKRLVV